MKYIFLIFLLVSTAVADYRIALIIDNSGFKEYPGSDETTSELSGFLRKSGFQVEIWKDLSSKDIDRKFSSFTAVTPVNSTLLVYFKGYSAAVEYKGVKNNFLLCPQSDYKNEADLSRRGIALDKIIKALEMQCGSRTRILALDVAKFPSSFAAKVNPLIQPKSEDVVFFSNLNPVSGKDSGAGLAEEMMDGDSANSILKILKKAADWSSVTTEMDGDEKADKVNNGPLRDGKFPGEEWVNKLGIVFCWIPPGEYSMGSLKSAPWYESDQLQKKVKIQKGFWMSKYELTNLQYKQIRGRDSGKFAVNKPNHPATVNFDDKKHLVKSLTEKSKLESGWEYDYPTEEQWEYAARAGSKEKYYFGSDDSKLHLYANFADKSLYDLRDGYFNYSDRSLNDGTPKIAEVGSYKPNAWGLHDMYGNVWEWCNTVYTEDRSIPDKKNKGKGQVVKGGSWCSQKSYCHSAFRHSFEGRFEQNFIGIRLIIQQK